MQTKRKTCIVYLYFGKVTLSISSLLTDNTLLYWYKTNHSFPLNRRATVYLQIKMNMEYCIKINHFFPLNRSATVYLKVKINMEYGAENIYKLLISEIQLSCIF